MCVDCSSYQDVRANLNLFGRRPELGISQYYRIHQRPQESHNALFGFHRSVFHLPSYYPPWHLPHLKTLICWAMGNSVEECSEYLIRCRFPVLPYLELQLTVKTERQAQCLLRLYQSRQGTLNAFYVGVKDAYFPVVVSQLIGLNLPALLLQTRR
jgi:hypothetical protein